MKPIRFGIVGFGVQGRAYAGFLTGRKPNPDLPDPPRPAHAVLGALCNRSDSAATDAAVLYPDVPFYRDWREMAASGSIDAVLIVTPHYSHPEIAAGCLAMGLPVLCDKPAGVYAKAAAEPLAAAKKSGAAYGILFNYRASGLWQKVRALVAGGELGEVRRSLWQLTSWWRPDAYYAQSPARGSWGGEGGGVLLNQAVHQLDLWQWICGAPSKVWARANFGAHRKITVENDVTLMAAWPSGASGCFTTCTDVLVGTDRLELDLSGGKILVEDGRRATVLRYRRSEEEVNAATGAGEMQRIISGRGLAEPLYDAEQWEEQEGWGALHVRTLENFALHLLTGEPLLAPAAEGWQAVELVNAALMSAWQDGAGQTVPVDPDAYLAALNRQIEAEGLYPTR